MKKLTRWNGQHPGLKANKAAQDLKERLRQLPKDVFNDHTERFIKEYAPERLPLSSSRGKRLKVCMSVIVEQFKIDYLRRTCMDLFAEHRNMNRIGPDLFDYMLEVEQRSLLKGYRAWFDNWSNQLKEKNEIIQVLPHNMEATCPHDTDGDGDCHICHKSGGGCIERPKQQRPFGWRVKSDPEDNYFLDYQDAVREAIVLCREGKISLGIEEI